MNLDDPRDQPKIRKHPLLYLHDVYMQPIGALFHGPHAIGAQLSKVSREDGGSYNCFGSHGCGMSRWRPNVGGWRNGEWRGQWVRDSPSTWVKSQSAIETPDSMEDRGAALRFVMVGFRGAAFGASELRSTCYFIIIFNSSSPPLPPQWDGSYHFTCCPVQRHALVSRSSDSACDTDASALGNLTASSMVARLIRNAHVCIRALTLDTPCLR